MNRSVALPLLLLLAFALPAPAAAQEQKAEPPQNYDELARRLITTSVNIKPGDVVVVVGGRHNIPLMEAISIEAQKAGGMVTMFLSTDRVTRSFNVDVPEKYLEQEPRFLAEWIKHIDVWIALPEIEDQQAVNAGVPEARFAKLAKAGQFFAGVLNEAKIRGVSIGYPTTQQAARNNVDFSTLERMHWAAVNADYQSISGKGDALKRLLQGAKSVRITTPAGTDFTFSTGGRPVFANDGVVTPEDAQSKQFVNRWATLPGGRVTIAPIETSASGKVVVPRTQCRFAPLTGVSFEFRGGKMEGFKADKGGECFQETMAPYSGSKDVLGTVLIGLNPALKVIDQGGDYRPSSAAGMVWIYTGDNELQGGNNKAPGGFGFPLTNATVTVDGKVVVKDGQLVL